MTVFTLSSMLEYLIGLLSINVIYCVKQHTIMMSDITLLVSQIKIDRTIRKYNLIPFL